MLSRPFFGHSILCSLSYQQHTLLKIDPFLFKFTLSVVNTWSPPINMPLSIDKIVDGFPFPTINPIVRTPNYESIAEIHLRLNSNAASVQSNLRCGTLGLLFLTISPAVYSTLLTVAFVPPVNPGTKPNIPSGATGAAIADLRYHHAADTNVFTEYENTDKALC